MLRLLPYLVVAALVGMVPAGAATAPEDNTDRVLGKADAPVTVIEYASLDCPHCAEFDTTVLPGVKKDFIDTGKVKLVLRDFPLSELAVKAAAIARCAPEDRYFAFMDVLFQQQESWVTAKDPVAALSQLARLGGMSQAQVDECVKNQKIADAILAERIDGAKQFDIQGTPTLVVNGKKVDNPRTYADFEATLKRFVPQ